MTRTNQSTKITNLSWGSIEVTIDGEPRKFRDARVWPGGALEWDWNETGTQHEPGTQPADIREILEQGVDVLVLSRGQQLRLQVHPDTKRLLEEKGIEYHVKETREAVALFNDLVSQGRRAGGIFHSTC